MTNKIACTLLALVLVFASPMVRAQEKVTHKKTVTTTTGKKKHHKKRHRKKVKTKNVEIIHHSDDDKKLQEIKDAKNKQKGAK